MFMYFTERDNNNWRTIIASPQVCEELMHSLFSLDDYVFKFEASHQYELIVFKNISPVDVTD